MGRLARDNELRFSSNGMAVLKNAVAVDRRVANKEKETDFIPVVMFGKTAEFANTYLGKGCRVTIQGEIRVSSYQKEGDTVWKTEVIVDRIQPIDWKSEDQQDRSRIQPKKVFESDSVLKGFNFNEEDEDLPF